MHQGPRPPGSTTCSLDSLPTSEPRLQALRAAIAAAAPDAVEAISYGAPAFRYRGRPLVSYAAAKAHCSFFPMSLAVLDLFRDDLAGFDLARGTIRFAPDRPIPADVVAGIVRARMAEIDAAHTR